MTRPSTSFTLLEKSRFSVVSAVCLSISTPGCQRLPTEPSPPDFQVLYRTVIGHSARHSAFPSVAVVNDSDLVVVFREGFGHVSSDGRITMSRSTDGGRSFSEPATIIDTPLDDRDPAPPTLRDGRLAVNFFALDGASDDMAPGLGDRRHLYVVFSDDDGQNWSPLVEAQQPLHDQRLASRSQLLDMGGRTLLWPVYYAEAGSSLLYRSPDGGQTWRFFSLMADSTVAAFVEPSLVQLSSGRLLASFRTRPHRGGGIIYLSQSLDVGRTWSRPRALTIWGFPQHMLQLQPTVLLMTYGYRRPPFGVRFAVSYDLGVEWIFGDRLTLDARSVTIDVGYPHSVLLPDGSVYVVYYLTLGKGKIQVWGLRFTIDLP